MGLQLDTGRWGCLRDSAHRGRKPERLIVALAGCSWAEAAALVDDQPILEPISTHGMLDQLAEILAPKHTHEPPIAVELPSSFQRPQLTGLSSRFARYLVNRGFRRRDVAAVIERYDLRYTFTGRFKGRLVMPITVDDRLVGWTGRAIVRAEQRYLSEPAGPHLKKNLFNYDRAADGGRLLAVVEGPLDALKVDFYGSPLGVHAVAMLTTSLTDGQRCQLLTLSRRFDDVVVIGDSTALGVAAQTTSTITFLGAYQEIIEEAEDPGALSPRQVKRIFTDILENMS